MKIVYARRALRDIDEILAYVRKRSPRGAHVLSLTIERAIKMCAVNPRAAPKTNEPNLYRHPLRKYRYTIFYRDLGEGEGIEIARVVHSARVKDLRKLPRR